MTDDVRSRDLLTTDPVDGERDDDLDEDLDDDDLLDEPRDPHPSRLTGLLLAGLGALGLYAAFSLAWDKVKLLEDPSFVPGCDLNPVLSCGTVMVTPQAEVFGFPNPFLGLIGFSVVITVGVLLAAGTRLPRPVLAGLAVGSLAGLTMVHWLAFQSLYRIDALCPWCLVVWTVTIPIAVVSTLSAARTYAAGSRVVGGLWEARWLVVLFWYLAFAVAITVRFWDFWKTQV